MSRIGLVEEENFPGEFFLQERNRERSLAGKKGQAALRELVAALEAMPEKRLCKWAMVDDEGEVCALGAYVLRKRIQRGDTYAQAIKTIDHEGENRMSHDLASHYEFPAAAAWAVAFRNDEILDRCSPEERHALMLEWARAQIKEIRISEEGA